jgi:Holliday junction resolvase RusA-like endonuclease
MKLLVSFKAIGVPPVPWSVPNIGVANRGGKRVRFARRGKKSCVALGKANLEDWQRLVATNAKEAMDAAGLSIQTGPLCVSMKFLRQTPEGRRDGELWTVPVKWDEAKEKFVKQGRSEPDVTNLFKGTEDALHGVVFGDDCQDRMISARTCYGRFDGVEVRVYAIEPGDFPGDAE